MAHPHNHARIRSQSRLGIARDLNAVGRRFRPAAALQSLILVTCGAACLGAAAVVFDPASLQAGSAVSNRLPEVRPVDRAADALALIHGCKRVLAAHNRGETPYTELVLWMDDDVNPGAIDSSEIAVVCHSKLFRTITVYSLAAGRSEQLMRPALPLGTVTFSDPAFCDQWRSLPQIRPVTIATGISDMRLEPAGAMDHSARGAATNPESRRELSTFGTPMRLRLRWTGDSTDGPQETTSIIAVGTRPTGRQE